MLYMLMINYDPNMPFEGRILQPEHAKLEAELRDRGVFVSGAGLFPVEAGGAFRVREGTTLKTDGPFTETKEVLGGYYIVDCDETEAIEVAGRIPIERRSYVEVRRIALFHPNPQKELALSHPGS